MISTIPRIALGVMPGVDLGWTDDERRNPVHMRRSDGGAFLHTLLAAEEMTLLKRLQDTRAWLTETTGAKHVSPKLTLAELDWILAALEKIESRIAAQENIRKPLSNCA